MANDVNTDHSIEDILDNVNAYPPHRCSPSRDVAAEVLFQSIEDFVNTMRQLSSSLAVRTHRDYEGYLGHSSPPAGGTYDEHQECPEDTLAVL